MTRVTGQYSVSALAVEPGSAIAYRRREPLPPRPAALLILLHGVGGNEANLAELAASVERDAVVVLPGGGSSSGPARSAGST
jgi:phospholipase/carboxylesterase